MQRPPRPTLFPYTTLFRSSTRTLLWCRMKRVSVIASGRQEVLSLRAEKFSAVLKAGRLEDRREFFSAQGEDLLSADRKSTRLNSSHVEISYAVFCLKKKKK